MTVLADAGGGFGAGFIAFFVVAALGVSLYFLIRSMNRHLRRVPPSFDAEPDVATPDAASPGSAPTDAAASPPPP